MCGVYPYNRVGQQKRTLSVLLENVLFIAFNYYTINRIFQLSKIDRIESPGFNNTVVVINNSDYFQYYYLLMTFDY